MADSSMALMAGTYCAEDSDEVRRRLHQLACAWDSWAACASSRILASASRSIHQPELGQR